MERSQTMKNVEIWEWNGPEQWKIWKFGMERSRTIENTEIWEWNGPEQLNEWKFGNGTVPHNEKYAKISEWNGPAQ